MHNESKVDANLLRVAGGVRVAVLGLPVRPALVFHREFGYRVEIDAGSAPRRGLRVALTQDVDDDTCDACVRLTQGLVVRAGAAGHIRLSGLIEKCATFDASGPNGGDVLVSNRFSVDSDY